MELKDICIDFKYAKKFKELGVKQDSLFYRHIKPTKLHDTLSNKETLKNHSMKNIFDFWISAFTLEELMPLLPENIGIYFLCIDKFGCRYEDNGSYEYDIENTKTCDAVAEMIISLIKKEIINLEGLEYILYKGK